MKKMIQKLNKELELQCEGENIFHIVYTSNGENFSVSFLGSVIYDSCDNYPDNLSSKEIENVLRNEVNETIASIKNIKL